MARSSPRPLARRRVLAALAGSAALAGCSSLTNAAVELAVENRARTEQRVVAYVYPTGQDRPAEPTYEGSLPGGSRVIVPDVVEVPESGAKGVTVEVADEVHRVVETVRVTGPGTIVAMLFSDGIDVAFGVRD